MITPQRGLFSSNATTEEENDELYSNMKQAFELIDTDRSGFLDEKEMTNAIQALGITEIMFRALSITQITDQKVKVIFDEFDKNGDGKIDYEEFKEMLTSKIYKREPVDDVFDYFRPKDDKIEFEDFIRVAKQHFKYITEGELVYMFRFATKDDKSNAITKESFRKLYIDITSAGSRPS